MTPEAIEARQRILAELRDHAAKVFTALPAIRSIMFTLAQYYADDATDEVHTYVVASERDVPVWPHGCRGWDDFSTDGDICESCGGRSLGFSGTNDYVDLRTGGFAAYCHDHGNQDEPRAVNYLPYAIFRRDGSMEEVGDLLRGFVELAPEGEIVTIPPIDGDPRADELFEIACAQLADDGPRHVLADYLTERGDPRGEYIALALASSLDGDATVRRAALLEEHRAAWMSPLDRVVPASRARFERGLLAGVEVYAATPDICARVRAARAWRSVETLRYLPGSEPLLDHGMTALRDVGPVGAADLETLVGARRPWAIESLHVVIYDFHDREARALLATTTLPRLRSLTVSATDFDGLGELSRAVWLGQLERLTILDAYEITVPWLERAHQFAPVPWQCVSDRRDDRAAGWELAYRPEEHRFEVRLAGFSAYATRGQLVELLAVLATRGLTGPVELVGNRYWQPTDDDVRALSQTGRTVTRR